MIRAVLDTNVIASALVGERRPGNQPAAVLHRWQAGHFSLVTSEPLCDELDRTLNKPYFRRFVTPEHQRSVLAELRFSGEVVHPLLGVGPIAAHPEDDVVVATALAGDADYVVTGDRAFLAVGGFATVRFVPIGEFLLLLDTSRREHPHGSERT